MKPVPTTVIYRAALPRDTLAEVEGIDDPAAFVAWVADHLATELRCPADEAARLIAWCCDDRGAFALPVPLHAYNLTAAIVADRVAVRLRETNKEAA